MADREDKLRVRRFKIKNKKSVIIFDSVTRVINKIIDSPVKIVDHKIAALKHDFPLN